MIVIISLILRLGKSSILKVASESDAKSESHPEILGYFSLACENHGANQIILLVHRWYFDWPDFNSNDVEYGSHTFVTDSPNFILVLRKYIARTNRFGLPVM